MPPESLPEEETTTNGWLSRAARYVADVLRVQGGWDRMPADPSRFGEKPVAAIVEYPHDFELCDPPELGYKRRESGIPPRTDGTRPRAV